MPAVSRGQIDRAKQADILDYILAYEPDNIRRVGNAYYLKDHGSLRISNGLWNWHSQGVGGKNVVDYLIKVRGYSFVDAVRRLAGDDLPSDFIAPKARPPTGAQEQAGREMPGQNERKPFALPPRNKNNDRVIAYLEHRGIDKRHILGCIDCGSLYESAQWHNAVFVGRDDKGKARYACMRGTTGDFKRDADGSDKKFGFALPPLNSRSDTLMVYESAVDALSHQTLYPEFDGWRLSLGCTSLAALAHFLERHGNIRHVAVGTDNDKAGDIAAAKIMELPHVTATRSPPPTGKDWNEALMAIKSGSKPSLIGRLEAAKEAADEINSLTSRERTGGSLSL